MGREQLMLGKNQSSANKSSILRTHFLGDKDVALLVDLGMAAGACGGSDNEMEAATGVMEAHDEGILADATRAANDND